MHITSVEWRLTAGQQGGLPERSCDALYSGAQSAEQLTYYWWIKASFPVTNLSLSFSCFLFLLTIWIRKPYSTQKNREWCLPDFQIEITSVSCDLGLWLPDPQRWSVHASWITKSCANLQWNPLTHFRHIVVTSSVTRTWQRTAAENMVPPVSLARVA